MNEFFESGDAMLIFLALLAFAIVVIGRMR